MMITFIAFLRALAACLITNAHYTGIYPTDLIANGGLMGDVIFFAVSGFCLYNVRLPFPEWYGKRLIRVYIPVILATAVYFILGFYSVSAQRSLIWWFAYPTYYHFVASIILLYIPFYVIMKVDTLKNNLPILMSVIAAVYFAVYILAYDKTYYHIDTVREPMIRFLFMESMLLGGWFRQNDKRYRNRSYVFPFLVSMLMFGIYIISKVSFSRFDRLSQFQICNQIILFGLLYFVFRLFAALDSQLNELPKAVKTICFFTANITLEIYLVQYVLIDIVRPHLYFPANWIVLTALIILSAAALHLLCKPIIGKVNLLTEVFTSSCSRRTVSRRGDR